VIRDAAQDELVGQHVDDVCGVELAIDTDRRSPPAWRGSFLDLLERVGVRRVMAPARGELALE
jgi:hypothetical protein